MGIFKNYYVNIDNSYRTSTSATVGTDGVIVYPPIDGMYGGSSRYPMNWHQFLGALQSTVSKSNQSLDTVIYYLEGTRVISNGYSDVVLNQQTSAYDINIGFDYNTAMENPQYPTQSYISHNVITSTSNEPYRIVLDVTGGTLRFNAYITNVYFVNGMLQSLGGGNGPLGGNIVFDRYLFDHSYDYSGILNATEFMKLSRGYQYPTRHTGVSSNGDRELFEFDNMWITSNGNVDFTGSIFKTYNCFIRAANKLKTTKNYRLSVGFHNSIVLFHDYALSDNYWDTLGKTPNGISMQSTVNAIKPFSFSGGCAVSQTLIGAADPTKIFINTYGNLLLAFQRDVVFNSPQTVSSVLTSAPSSIATSAIQNLNTTNLRYNDAPWTSLSAVSINTRARMETQYSSVTLKEVNNTSLTTGAVVSISKFIQNSKSSAITGKSQPCWFASSVNGSIVTSVHRDGIGPLFFPGFEYTANSNNTSVEGFINSVRYSPYVDFASQLLEVGDTNIYYANDGAFNTAYTPTLYKYVGINGLSAATVFSEASHLEVIGTVPAVNTPIIYYYSFNRWYNRSVVSTGNVKYTQPTSFSFYIKDAAGDMVNPQYGIMYAGYPYTIVVTNTTTGQVGSTIFTNIMIQLNKYNPSEQIFTPAIGGVAGTNGATTFTFVPSKPTRWTNIDVILKCADGSYDMKSARYYISELNRMFYVDISTDYENSITSFPLNSRAYDTFSGGVITYPGWSVQTPTHYAVSTVWGDWSLVNKDYIETNLVELSASIYDTAPCVFDYKFSMIRSAKEDVITFTMKDPQNDWNISIIWEYLNSRMRVTKRSNQENYTYVDDTIPYSSSVYAYDLRCDNSLRQIDFRITNDTEDGNIELYYTLSNSTEQQYDGDLGTINGHMPNVWMNVSGNTLKSGFGYFDLNANYGFGYMRGSEDYPLTYTQFRDFIGNASSVKYGDIFKLRGYRSIQLDKFAQIKADDIYFMDWDNSLYGPWIFNFANGSLPEAQKIQNYTVDLSKVSMYNGIIYNSYSLTYFGTLKIRKLFDVMLTWKKSNGTILFTTTYRRDSKYLTYNMFGSTISQY